MEEPSSKPSGGWNDSSDDDVPVKKNTAAQKNNQKITFTEIKWEGNNVLLFGSEGFGMREHTGKYTDFLVRIDINKGIESLNISNSAAIVFHHLAYLKKNLD